MSTLPLLWENKLKNCVGYLKILTLNLGIDSLFTHFNRDVNLNIAIYLLWSKPNCTSLDKWGIKIKIVNIKNNYTILFYVLTKSFNSLNATVGD